MLLLVLLSLSGCGGRGGALSSGAPASAWRAIPTTARVYYDNAGGIRDSLRLVVRDEATLRAVWSQATSAQTAPPPAPEVDFQREMLLVVGAGRMAPEDQIRVDSVAVVRGSSGQALMAIVRLSEGCRRMNIDAYPLEIVRVGRIEGEVEFVERRDRAPSCP
ncbi:MAG TPA: hypothetical protein VMN39_06620 [Longimicrobiaceae bacterium]|nr:hypothetical protein [Longimicrobiaceae bacterium]